MTKDAADATYWYKKYIETSQKAQDYAAKVGEDMERLEVEIDRMAKVISDQDAMLTRQAERIVDLQTHIANLEGEE